MKLELHEFLLRTHQFAISAHNVQPFQFHFTDEQVHIYVNPKRRLPAADPHEKDLRMSLGALSEAWNIALSEKGFSLKLADELGASHQQQNPYAIFILENKNKMKSELFHYQKERFSYRGSFSKMDLSRQEDLQKSLRACGLAVIVEKAEKKHIAKMFNDINLRFLLKDGYVEELYSWLRFDEKDPKYFSDGLSKESLALNNIESLGAAVVLKPKIFRFLNKIGTAKFLVDEANKILSAPFLIGIVCDKNTNDFERGQIFYRKWLELSRLKIFGSPLSLLTDEPEILEKVCNIFQLANAQTLVNIIRCGDLPKNYRRYRPARLSDAELIWSK